MDCYENLVQIFMFSIEHLAQSTIEHGCISLAIVCVLCSNETYISVQTF